MLGAEIHEDACDDGHHEHGFCDVRGQKNAAGCGGNVARSRGMLNETFMLVTLNFALG